MADKEDGTSGIVAARETGGRFAKGNPGRPVGTRVKLTASFLNAAYRDFEKHGADTFEIVRKTDPGTYLKVIAALLPKEVAGEGGGPIQVTIRRFNEEIEK